MAKDKYVMENKWLQQAGCLPIHVLKVTELNETYYILREKIKA